MDNQRIRLKLQHYNLFANMCVTIHDYYHAHSQNEIKIKYFCLYRTIFSININDVKKGEYYFYC